MSRSIPDPLPAPGTVPVADDLSAQREAFARRRFLAMPLAGALAWTAAGIAGAVLPLAGAVWALFITTGAIAYLGIGLSRFTGEHFMDRSRPRNPFDALFFSTVAMALLVYAIAIPFFMVEPTSLPLSVGILSGLMWLPTAWLIRHWIGAFHAIARTVLVLAAWLAWPEARFVAVPAVIVAIYAVTIVVLERRWKQLGERDVVAPRVAVAGG